MSYSTGYKSGGINTDRIDPRQNPVFNAEKARSIEFGLKHEWQAHNLRMNLAIHDTAISDFQATTFTGTGFNLQNAGDIDTKGLELEVSWAATASTTLHGAFARTLASFDKFEQGPCWVAYTWQTGIDDPGRQTQDQPFCSRAGNRVGFEPEDTLAVRLEQAITLLSHDTLLSIDYLYTGDLFLDDTNDPLKQVPSSQVANIRYLVALNELDGEIVFWVRNLFDENYTQRNGFDVPIQPGKIMSHTATPRSYGLTFNYHF